MSLAGPAARAPHIPHTAMVTGAAGGIGWATVQRLAALGCRCVLVDLQADALQARVVSLGSSHHALVCDLSDLRAAAALPARAADCVGPLDVVVNNAGVTTAQGRSNADLQASQLRHVLDVNLNSVMAIGEQAPDSMSPHGSMVNIASGAAFRALPLRGVYSASKAGVAAWTAAWAPAWREHGLGLRAVAPGFIVTAMTQNLAQQGALNLSAAQQRIPLGRLGQVQDVADVVCWLSGLPSDVFQGQTLMVDGGSSSAAGACLPAAPHRLTDEMESTPPRISVTAFGDFGREFEQALRHCGDASSASSEHIGTSQAMVVVVDDVEDWASIIEEVQAIAQCCTGQDQAPRYTAIHVLARNLGGPAAQVAQVSLHMWVRTLALELAPAGVRVNAVACGSNINIVELARAMCQLSGAAGRYVTAQSLDLGGA